MLIFCRGITAQAKFMKVEYLGERETLKNFQA
jgi:hypothetical protein